MATFDVSALPRKVQAAADALEKAEPRLVTAGSRQLERAITNAYRARTGDGRLSGTKTKRRTASAPVFAKFKDVQRQPSGAYVGLIVPKGAYGLIEQEIPEHYIDPVRATSRGAKGAATRGRRAAIKKTGLSVAGAGGAAIGLQKYLSGRSKALLINGLFAANASHPGIKNPKRVFHPAAVTNGPLASAAIVRDAEKIVRGAYKAAR